MIKIVVVEDDPSIREIMELVFPPAIYDLVLHASVSSFKKDEYKYLADVFLLDNMLPDGRGIDLCRALKSDSTTKEIPVVMMSAQAKTDDLKTEADAFIPKPFDIHLLIATIKNVL